ncbi:MAG: tRNA (N6-isopentenyl adenosine(37)-C2)-methylthiotransferase MiaB [Clostridiales Family XIII bacterium]|jgi:tRNA-2-methylthio-N6-dimethylallyladenosine synthase|nr:tRNA (N6-isopentenyl adenosine(37)-C2)-methylthiotransferase MiaB [Clostridiales Family XIII bacterium]
MKKKYHIITLGCQMNERDSETLAGFLEERGYEKAAPASSPGGVFDGADSADILILNTCSVRENADNRFFGLLGRAKHIKERRPETIVAVCGCMMQQQHIVDQIRGSYGWVDMVFGTHNIHEFPRLLENVASESEKAYRVLGAREEIVEDLPAKRAYGYKAFVNIMFGCNNFCTYCIVPYTRGREQSRRPEDILREVEGLAAAGTKEVMLLGQNVNSYRGAGADGTAVDFPALIRMLDGVDGLARLRFMTSHPKDLSDGLVEAFARCRTLCPSIHLPVQAGSNAVLARMNRRYTREAYMALVEKLRAARPGIAVTTDLIVGFPGETDADFADTMDLIERVRFDAAFTFLYSPRQGTPAATYEDQVPEEVKHARFNRMVERLNEITLEINRGYVGRTLPVLIEGPDKARRTGLTGRTETNKLVNILAGDGDAGCASGAGSAGSVQPGDIRDVRITDVNTFSFTGELA